MMRRCELPARDLRLLDPLFVYPSAILGRERAVVCNLERIRCIITADEALVLRDPDADGGAAAEEAVRRYVDGLQRRLVDRADDLPFEFIALEVALEAACSFLDAQAVELEAEAYPLLDELTAKISTLDLERARRLKSKLVALTRRVQKVRDEIEQLMDDDGDMAEMYLTEKKMRMEASSLDEEGLQGIAGNNAFGTSVSAPVSPVSSPPAPRRLEKQFSFARSRHSSFKSSESSQYNIEELEMLLEAYFVVIDYTLSKLTSVQSMNCLLVSLLFSLISLLRNTLADNFAIYIPFSQLKEYIDDTEDFINIQLIKDHVKKGCFSFKSASFTLPGSTPKRENNMPVTMCYYEIDMQLLSGTFLDS
uniref:Magnesium transporter n=1 Tax=Aegilops tauschii TaxID=37682 RepID=N1QS98_AEGTA